MALVLICLNVDFSKYKGVNNNGSRIDKDYYGSTNRTFE